jgi:hypothetical protein
MKDPTFAPVFATMYRGLCDRARSHGYALAIHGTMNMDFDLVAIPWTNEASNPYVLIQSLAELVNILDGNIDHGLYKEEPEIKPHGRLAWLLLLGSGAALDISVMPRIT